MNTDVRKLLYGRVLTNISDSFIYMAILWYINDTYSNPLLVASVFFIESGVDALSFLFGPIIDRSKGTKLIVACGRIQLICAVFLSVLFFFRSSSYAYVSLILLLLLITTVCSGIIYPSETKLLPMLTSKENLVKINGIFQTTYKSLDVFLNALATAVIAFFDVQYTLIISMLLFSVSVYMYKHIIVSFSEVSGSVNMHIKLYMIEMKEGFSELTKHIDLLRLLIPLVGINLFFGISNASLPIFTSQYLGSSPISYGGLLMISSLGGIIGSMYVGRLKINDNNRKKFITLMLVFAGISWLVLPLSININPYFGLLGVGVSSFFINMMNILFISLIQVRISSDILGRVATINESLLSFMIPLGNLLGGIFVGKWSSAFPQYLYGFSLIIFGISYSLKFSKKIIGGYR